MNQLRRLLEQGILRPDDLTENELAQLMDAPTPQPRYDIPEVPMNSMRTETGPEAGKVTSLNFRDAAGRQAPGGMTWDDLNASMGQQQPPGGLTWDDLRARTGKRQMRVVGAGGGSTVDLSPEDAGGPVALDYTRAPVDVPGVGKAYYSKDGRGAYVMGPDGQPATKVILGYDDAGSRARDKANQEIRAKEATIGQTMASTASSEATAEHTRESTEALRAQRNVKEDPYSQAVLEKRFGKAEKGFQWSPDGRQVRAPGGEKVESANEVLNLLTEAEPILKSPDTTGSGAGALMDKGAGFFGKATAGAKNTGRLQAIAGLVVSKMPRMEGPQSNLDVMQYREMAGQLADDSLPVERRLAALETIRQINAKYSGGTMGQPPAATPAPAASATPAPEKRVVGQVYDTPKGKLRWVGNGWTAP